MASNPDPSTPPWRAADKVYVAIVGLVLLAAFVEWFLWLAAFLYCLVKVYQKAEHWSIRLLSVVQMVAFSILRTIFLPVMVVTLPLPGQITRWFPKPLVEFLQLFAFYTFAILLTVPWLLCIYQVIVKQIGRTKIIKWILDETTAPKTVVVMPCYKEEPEVLVTAINSVIECDYPASCIHVFLSFDGDQEDELYLSTIEKLGVPLTLKSYPKCIDVIYKGSRITISRFPHGGKRHCQKSTFRLIDKIYTEYILRNDNLFILFIDSDCILDPVCIQNFMYEMELKPGSKQNMLAMTGIITSTTQKNSLITLLQDMEYIHGQLFERSIESGCGAVTCLPGALTMLRFSAFRKMAKYYFADKAEQCDDLFDYGKCHLGEDRWLTHLFMIGAKQRYQIQLCTGAFCKTEAVQTYKSLLKQRRRWFLGFITNEVCMLTDFRLWKRYPLLCVIRFMNNTIRTTALLFFIMIISIITTSNKIQNLPVGFLAVSLGLNWLMMIYFGFKLRRFKVWLYPVMFVINPFFNWVYMVYGIFTAGQRTWGGPRADAAAADSTTTPQQAIEKAKATGDELNIVPETFKPAVEARHPDKVISSVPVVPADRVEGRFAAPERMAGGFYLQSEDSGLTLPNGRSRDRSALRHRDSFESYATGTTRGHSVYMPRRIDELLTEEDRKKYAFAQGTHRHPSADYTMSEEDRKKVLMAQKAVPNTWQKTASGNEISSAYEEVYGGQNDRKTSVGESEHAWDSGDETSSPPDLGYFQPRPAYRPVFEPSLTASSVGISSPPARSPTESMEFPEYSLEPRGRSRQSPYRDHPMERSPLREVALTRVPTGQHGGSSDTQDGMVQQPLIGGRPSVAASTDGQETSALQAGSEDLEEGPDTNAPSIKRKRGRFFKRFGNK